MANPVASSVSVSRQTVCTRRSDGRAGELMRASRRQRRQPCPQHTPTPHDGHFPVRWPGVTTRRVTRPDDPAVAAAERIYVAAIPAAERKASAWFRALPMAGRSTLVVAERADAVVGFAAVFVPTGPADAALLEYLAVADAARGGGVGGALVDHVLRTVDRPLLIEVQANDADADRRRAFYRRHGCRDVLGLAYQLPLPNAPPMTLMLAGPPAVSRAELSRWLATVYADVYGRRRDDPRLSTMVVPLPDPVALQ